MNSLLPSARIALCLFASGLLLAPRLALAEPTIEVAKDLPADQRERLQLAVDAMTKDRPKHDYAAAKKKLAKALALCKKVSCPTADQAQIEFFLGIVTAEGGDEKSAQQGFERALKVNPTLDPSGGLSSPPVDRAFAAAKATLPPPPVAKVPEAPPAPVDAGFNQPSAQSEPQPLSSVGGANFRPGLGFVLGGDPGAGNVKTDGSAATLSVPSLDQSSIWDERHFRYNVGLSFTDFKFNTQSEGQKKLGSLLLDLRFGESLPLWGFLVPSIDFGLSGGKFGESPKLLLFSGGNYELWNFNGDARFGLDLSLGWFQLGGFGGGFLSYYVPSLENLPNEPSVSGKDAGPLYGGRVRLGHDLFVELSYTWRVGELATGRYRRIELGELDDDDSGWSLFWEAREQPKDLAPSTATQEARLSGGMPLNYSLGFSFRNY